MASQQSLVISFERLLFVKHWLILSVLHVCVLWGRGLKVSCFTEMVSLGFSGIVTTVSLAEGR